MPCGGGDVHVTVAEDVAAPVTAVVAAPVRVVDGEGREREGQQVDRGQGQTEIAVRCEC